MSDSSISREFPPEGLETLDRAAVIELLREFVPCYVSLLAGQTVNRRTKTVFRPSGDGVFAGDVDIPDYWATAASASALARTALELPAVRSLFDYLWRCGACRLTLSGPDPRRVNWEVHVLVLEVNPLIRGLLQSAARDEAIAEGNATPWRIPSPVPDDVLAAMAQRLCDRRATVLARCPLWPMSVSPGACGELGEGVTLCSYSPHEEATYLTIANELLHSEDIRPRMFFRDEGILEIKSTISLLVCPDEHPPRTLDQRIRESVSDTLSLAKWALMLAIERPVPLVERAVTYLDVPGDLETLSGHFRRDYANGGTPYDLTADNMARARELFVRARAIVPHSPGLRQVLWFWDRSCLATLERDGLLEAMIGLDGLLVPNPGESRYRFGLHGASLLADTPDQMESIAKALRGLYNERSSAAHGGIGGPGTSRLEALGFLGKAINAVVILTERGVLDPKQPIAKQIERLVLRRCVLMG